MSLKLDESSVHSTNHPFLTYHLSAPFEQSINDFIDPSSYSLSYCTIDNAYRMLNELGPGALMSKIDLKNAFHLIPVRPQDWNLLGIYWRQQFFVDTCLPLGLRSGPYLFSQLLIAIHWILQHSEVFNICRTTWTIFYSWTGSLVTMLREFTSNAQFMQRHQCPH